ncbi:MAG: hypothetical protein DHS20C01_18910 [marine bacterium B5-7]|nr:MAG: hypothetical protein DHS20C01_18910 [marine bacterium B5-7]
MEAIYLLIPLAAVLVLIIIVGFLWAVRSGQFDDLEGPAYSILMDDDEMPPAQDQADSDDDTTRKKQVGASSQDSGSTRDAQPTSKPEPKVRQQESEM